jgi:hypothetical protein
LAVSHIRVVSFQFPCLYCEGIQVCPILLVLPLVQILNTLNLSDGSIISQFFCAMAIFVIVNIQKSVHTEYIGVYNRISCM